MKVNISSLNNWCQFDSAEKLFNSVLVCELYGDPTVPVNRDHAKVCYDD